MGTLHVNGGTVQLKANSLDEIRIQYKETKLSISEIQFRFRGTFQNQNLPHEANSYFKLVKMVLKHLL